MRSFKWSDPVDAPEPLTDAEAIEAEVRRLMARHAAIEPRGWSTSRERAVIHRRIDLLLDGHKLARALEAT